ncbi:MAG: Uma2 family endonuclease [Tetrasphaera sp.]
MTVTRSDAVVIRDDHIWTRAELDALPDDGYRHEIIDGVLIMTPSPSFGHQGMVGELHLALRAACPPGLVVLMAPFDVALDDISVLEPDLLVAPRAEFTDKDLPGPPLLAIEVLSPSTQRVDRTRKLPRFARAGCPSFWLADPREPSLTAYELVGGDYEQVAHVVGDQAWTARQPFEVTLSPARLIL